MTAPSNTVYSQGTGAPPVSADNLNTFVQTVSTLASARGFSGTTGMEISLQGYAGPNDGGQGNFIWIVGTGTDDGGVTTIVPTGNTSGYWSRKSNGSVVVVPQTVNSASTANLSAPDVTNRVLIRSGATTVSDAWPAASAIIAAISGAQPGSMLDLMVINENSGNYTMTPGSGVTFSGNLSSSNFVMSTATQRMFRIFIASATAVTVYG